jgi:hypothetical protein
MKVPTKPDEFFGTFAKEIFMHGTKGQTLPPVPYKVIVGVGEKTYGYRVEGGELMQTTGEPLAQGDIRVSLSAADFDELARAARAGAADELPPAPAVSPTYQFPPIADVQGHIRIVIDDLGDKRTIDVLLGAAGGGKPTATVHTNVDFLVGLQGKTLAVEQILKAGGVKIDGDLGYLLRVANAMTGKVRRRER